MPTQQEIADHLGITQQAVSAQMEPLGIDWRNETMERVRLRYLEHLRGVAAGHRSADGMDLARERALTEQVDREIKQLTLAEKKGQLVNLAQLEPELQRMVAAFRTELLSRDDKLKGEIDALYDINLDPALLNEHTRNALKQLARYEPGSAGADAAPGGELRAAGSHVDHRVGAPAASPLAEGDGQAGSL